MMPFRSAALRRTVLIALILTVGWALAAWPARSQAAPLTQGPIAVITSPKDGQELQGVVTITGSANHPEFDRYELAYGPEPNPNDAWQPFASNQQPVADNVLGVWDTASVADGNYSLRLRVVRKDSNYDEAFIRGLRVINQQARSTPTPSAEASPTPEATTDLATAVPGVEPTLRSVPTVLVEQPPTSIPAAVAPGATATPARNTAGSGGLAALVDLGPIISTCLSGAIVAGFVFAVLGVIQFGRVQYRNILRYKYKKSRTHADSHTTPPATDGN